jgi:uncharacterized protein
MKFFRMSRHSFFFFPVVVSACVLCGVWYVAGFSAFLLACTLAVLEVTLSFDNAVINAKVLSDMPKVWQERFLTWGMLLSVVGTRLILPIGIVAIAAWMSPLYVAQLALYEPAAYAELLEHMHAAISAFGAAFLGLVALMFFFDDAKQLHWVHALESRFSRLGHIEALEIGLVLGLLALVTVFVPEERGVILLAGIVGVLTHIGMHALTSSMKHDAGADRRIEQSGAALARSGFAAFMYLNVLDSAFSLDGVIGAFAITTNLLVVVVGLGIGAYFVRSMTLFMVAKGTLASLRFLEHGAHWAVLGLAVCMGVSLVMPVPEFITAGVGLCFVCSAWYSSKHVS